MDDNEFFFLEFVSPNKYRNLNLNRVVNSIQFTIIILSIFYSILFVLFILQLYRLVIKERKFRSTLAFYIAIVIAVASRAITLAIIFFNENIKQQFSLSYFLLILPDMINVCVYVFLVWNYFLQYSNSHILLGNDIQLFELDHSSESTITNRNLFIFTFLYMVAFIVLSVLTMVSILEEETLSYINSFFNILTPFFAIVYWIYLLCKYSGSPLKDVAFKSKLKWSFVVCIIWTAARMAEGIVNISNGKFYIQKVIEELLKPDSEDYIISLVATLFLSISEIVPSLLTLNTNVIDFYLIEEDKKQRLVEISFDQIDNNYIDKDDNIEDIEGLINNDPIHRNRIKSESLENRIVLQREFIISKKDFTIGPELQFKTKHSLGSIYTGNLNNLNIAIRSIEFDRLSRYDLETLNKDIDEIM